MPWYLESMKGVDDCDKPRLGVERPLTRGFPNGETQMPVMRHYPRLNT
jgi:hypothetical protein